MVFAFGKFAIQAYAFALDARLAPADVRERRGQLVHGHAGRDERVEPEAAEGSISIAFNEYPASPAVLRDKGYLLFKTILHRFDPSVNSKDGYAMYGMSAAYTMVDALRHGGKNLTRQSVMTAATHLSERGNPFLLHGIYVHTTPRARFPVSQAKLQRWHNGRWVQFGKLVR